MWVMCVKCNRGAASVEIVTLIFADPVVCGYVLNIFCNFWQFSLSASERCKQM